MRASVVIWIVGFFRLWRFYEVGGGGVRATMR
jgi:hypothetical protein